MCRSIKPLRRADSETTTGEIEAAALQFVRKVSNYRTPSSKNQEAFDAFGPRLMPVLQQHKVDPGQPAVMPVVNIVP